MKSLLRGGKAMQYIYVKMQIACLCFIGYLTINYLLNKRIRTYSSKVYFMMLWACIINLLLDVASISTLYLYPDTSNMVNEVVTRAFIVSVDVFMALIATYLINLITIDQKMPIQRTWLAIVPLLPVVAMCFTDQLAYYVEKDYGYSYGPIVNVCYIAAVVYLGAVIYYVKKNIASINFKVKKTTIECIAICIIIMVLQKLYPQVLISGLATTLCTFSIYIAIENPNFFLENQFNFFNDFAFITVLKDKICKNDPFSVLVVMLGNIEDIREEYGASVERQLYEMVESYLHSFMKDGVYLYNTNTLMGIAANNDVMANYIEQIKKRFASVWKVEQKGILLNAQVECIDVDKDVTSVEYIKNKIIEMQIDIKHKKLYTDNLLGIRNRNGFESDIDVISPNRYQYESLCYITIDVNNLKIVNDQYGHAAGDELLKNCVNIISKALEDQGTLYRLGGDELGILLINKRNVEISELLVKIEEVRKQENQNKTHPVSFALGYAYFDGSRDDSLHEMVKRADKMMYGNKIEMKKQMKEQMKEMQTTR